MDMTEVIGVRFKGAGKVYYFDPAGIELKVDDPVVVQTTRGIELGRVATLPKQVPVSEMTQPLKPVLRKAEAEDLEQAEENRAKEQAALERCTQLAAKHRLPLKLLSAEYGLDGSRLTFFFSSEGRVDFRELVRELAAIFKTRVELRQLGPRDKAKLCGGFGRCGRPLCCASHLTEFDPVSIRMAKMQDLPLNPMKISGMCGRLLCCLAYENEQYREMKERLPQIGQQVITPSGPASVIGGSPLKETVLVQLESQATVELPLAEVSTGEKIGFKRDRKRRK